MERPRLSVVIPFYNVDRYLPECLESVASQTLEDIEVILVDDGSTDASAASATGFIDRDKRFSLVRQPNLGLGPARNTGVRHATGAYLTFVDSDDVLMPSAYADLVASLDASGSDLAAGGVVRFNRTGTWPSLLHRGIFDRSVTGTHITRRTDLIRDRTAWNKVYRRSFWDRYAFRFPRHSYEDAPVTVAAHVLAQAVDLLGHPIYRWRERDDGPPSITQRLFDAGHLDGRMRQVSAVADVLARHRPALRGAYDIAAMEHDLLILLVALPHVEPPVRDAILRFVGAFLDRADPGAWEHLPDDAVECYRLLRGGRIADLLAYVTHRPYTPFL